MYINQYSSIITMNTKILPITKARINLGSVVERVRSTGERVTLEKGGIPVASIVNIDMIEDLIDSLEIVRARKETQKDDLINWKKIRSTYT